MHVPPDRERRHPPDRPAQPPADPAAVRREGRPKHGAVRRDPFTIRAPGRHDHPSRHGQRIQPSLFGNPPGQSHLAVECTEKLVDVRDVRLQLDNEQRATTRVPGQDIDDSAFAVDGERDLGGKDPLRESRSEHAARWSRTDKVLVVAL